MRNRKRLSFLLIGILAAISLAGCGSSGDTAETKKEETTTAASTSAAEETTKAETSASPEETTADTAATEETTQEAADGSELSTALFTLTHSDDWTVLEDNTSDGDSYSYVDLVISEKDENLVECTVSATVSSASSYRDSLDQSGIDAYALV
ncbi:MAG TPA: hypothetical protein DGX96_11715, partial [Lachnospiraceae bacterium]|nr:hypothetical protein [Lachnospiraceae bacterium]